MQISPTSPSGQDFHVSLGSRARLSLRTGETVQAEVLSVTETAVAIRMKDLIVEARTTLPFKEGETIYLKVEGWEQEFRLRLLPREGDDIASIKNTILTALASLRGARPAAADLKLLSAFLKQLPLGLRHSLPELQMLEMLLPSVANITGGLLRDVIRDSGLFLETKLRLMVLQGKDVLPSPGNPCDLASGDLKAALLGLQKVLARSGIADALELTGVTPALLAGAVDNLLRNIEVLQLQSRLNDTLQVFVPFVWQDLREGELIFRESEQVQGDDRACSCTLNLDLERAGKLSAWALLQSGGMHINIAAESELFANVLREHAKLLEQQFETAGLRLGSLTIKHRGVLPFNSSRAKGLNIRI